MSLLKISGTKIVDKDGKEVILRGAGLGGWMKYVPFTSRLRVSLVLKGINADGLDTVVRRWDSMENFISGSFFFYLLFGVDEQWTDQTNVCTGYPGCEFQIRESLAQVIGAEKSEFFFDKVVFTCSYRAREADVYGII